MKKTALFLFSLLTGYLIGLNINQIGVTDSFSAEAMETVAQLEDGEERSDSDDLFHFAKFKVDGGGDDDSDGSFWLPELPHQNQVLGWVSVFEVPSVSIEPGAYPASFMRPSLFVLYRNFKVFPA